MNRARKLATSCARAGFGITLAWILVQRSEHGSEFGMLMLAAWALAELAVRRWTTILRARSDATLRHGCVIAAVGCYAWACETGGSTGTVVIVSLALVAARAVSTTRQAEFALVAIGSLLLPTLLGGVMETRNPPGSGVASLSEVLADAESTAWGWRVALTVVGLALSTFLVIPRRSE